MIETKNIANIITKIKKYIVDCSNQKHKSPKNSFLYNLNVNDN